VTKDLCD